MDWSEGYPEIVRVGAGDPERFAANHAGLADGRPFANRHLDRDLSLPYAGQPYFVSEFGGIWWNPDALDANGRVRTESWGYGDRVGDEEGFYARFEGLDCEQRAAQTNQVGFDWPPAIGRISGAPSRPRLSRSQPPSAADSAVIPPPRPAIARNRGPFRPDCG